MGTLLKLQITILCTTAVDTRGQRRAFFALPAYAENGDTSLVKIIMFVLLVGHSGTTPPTVPCHDYCNCPSTKRIHGIAQTREMQCTGNCSWYGAFLLFVYMLYCNSGCGSGAWRSSD